MWTNLTIPHQMFCCCYLFVNPNCFFKLVSAQAYANSCRMAADYSKPSIINMDVKKENTYCGTVDNETKKRNSNGRINNKLATLFLTLLSSTQGEKIIIFLAG